MKRVYGCSGCGGTLRPKKENHRADLRTVKAEGAYMLEITEDLGDGWTMTSWYCRECIPAAVKPYQGAV